MNVNELLDGSGFLSRKEKESFLNSSYLGTPWRIYHNLFEEYSEQKELASDFNNEVLYEPLFSPIVIL